MTEIPDSLLISSVFMTVCTTLLFFMILGISLFYCGLIQRRSSLSMMALPLLIIPVVFIEWFIVGYTLCYSPTSPNHYIGNFHFVGFKGLQNETLSTNRGAILGLNHALFSGLFKVICAIVAFPSLAERGRLLPLFIFIIIWSLIIYNPITYWHWNPNGWLYRLPVLEFAGGNTVHNTAGITALAYCYMLGKRSPAIMKNYRNSSTLVIIIGTFFCTIGWIGFNTGSIYQFSYQSLVILTNTLLAAFLGGFSWLLLDFFVRRKLTTIGFCSGTVAGLIGITPSAGYVAPWSSFVIGIISGLGCNLATRIKFWLDVDDPLDIFAIHGVGGIMGSLLTGVFSDVALAELGPETIEGGWINHHYIQLAYQLAGTASTSAYVFLSSCMVLLVLNRIPGCGLRAGEQEQMNGMDEYYFGEFTYDYIEFLRVLNGDVFDDKEE